MDSDLFLPVGAVVLVIAFTLYLWTRYNRVITAYLRTLYNRRT